MLTILKSTLRLGKQSNYAKQKEMMFCFQFFQLLCLWSSMTCLNQKEEEEGKINIGSLYATFIKKLLAFLLQLSGQRIIPQ